MDIVSIVTGILDKSWKHIAAFGGGACVFSLLNKTLGLTPELSVGVGCFAFAGVWGLCSAGETRFKEHKEKKVEVDSIKNELKKRKTRIASLSNLGGDEKLILFAFVRMGDTTLELNKTTDFDSLPFHRLHQKNWITYIDNGSRVVALMSAANLILLTDNQKLITPSSAIPQSAE